MVIFLLSQSNFYLYSFFKLQGLPQYLINQILHSNSQNLQINHYSFSHSNFYYPSHFFMSNNILQYESLNADIQSGEQMLSQSTHKQQGNVNSNFNSNGLNNQISNQQKNNIIKIQSQNIQKLYQIKEQIKKRKVQFKHKKNKKSLKQKKQRQKIRNLGQNSQRNIIPNQIHQTLSSVFKRSRSSKLIEKLLGIQVANGTCPQNASISRFYHYFSILKNKINHYANQKCLTFLTQLFDPKFEMYSLQEQMLYRSIGFKIIKNFLYSEGVCQILNSQRIKKENKCHHLAAIRFLQQKISELKLSTLYP